MFSCESSSCSYDCLSLSLYCFFKDDSLFLFKTWKLVLLGSNSSIFPIHSDPPYINCLLSRSLSLETWKLVEIKISGQNCRCQQSKKSEVQSAFCGYGNAPRGCETFWQNGWRVQQRYVFLKSRGYICAPVWSRDDVWSASLAEEN